MAIALLAVLGLVFGSFVTALSWRLKKEKDWVKDRSRCAKCKHVLAPRDLVPVFSWVLQGGKCRYCKKPISWQYPVIELTTSLLFVASYIFWPHGFDAAGLTYFIFWLAVVVSFMAMGVYDLRHMIIPNKLVYPMILLAAGHALIQFALFDRTLGFIVQLAGSVALAGGLYWAMFQLSKGKWIGGGDVKLGLLIGLTVLKPEYAFIVILASSLIGTLIALPLLVLKKSKLSSRLPYGPMLMAGCVIAVLFGGQIIDWYTNLTIFY